MTRSSDEGRRVAGIDCGTNTVRMLILESPVRPSSASLQGDGPEPHELLRRSRVVRLGEGVDETGAFSPTALARLAETLYDFSRDLRRFGVDASHLRFVATSASRDVRDPQPLLDTVESVLGVSPEIISGAQEADLTYAGATCTATTVSPAGKTLVIDLGGGSTELVVGDAARPTAAWSMNVGGVRLTERHLDDRRPMTAGQRSAIVADVRQALDEAEQHIPLHDVERVIGVSDSVGIIAAVASGIGADRRADLSGRQWSFSALNEACKTIVSADSVELAAMSIDHSRVDVVAAAAVIWAEVADRVSARSHLRVMTYSEHDILDGVTQSLLNVSGVSAACTERQTR